MEREREKRKRVEREGGIFYPSSGDVVAAEGLEMDGLDELALPI